MKYEILNEFETKQIVGGSLPTLSTVLAIGAIALITVTVFKIYQSSKGKSSFGSGFDFEWTIEDK